MRQGAICDPDPQAPVGVVVTLHRNQMSNFTIISKRRSYTSWQYRSIATIPVGWPGQKLGPKMANAAATLQYLTPLPRDLQLTCDVAWCRMLL